MCHYAAAQRTRRMCVSVCVCLCYQESVFTEPESDGDVWNFLWALSTHACHRKAGSPHMFWSCVPLSLSSSYCFYISTAKCAGRVLSSIHCAQIQTNFTHVNRFENAFFIYSFVLYSSSSFGEYLISRWLHAPFMNTVKRERFHFTFKTIIL